VGDERGVRDVPGETKLGRRAGHRPAVLADSFGGQASGATRDPGTGRDLLGQRLGEDFPTAPGGAAAPLVLVPHQHRRIVADADVTRPGRHPILGRGGTLATLRAPAGQFRLGGTVRDTPAVPV